MTNKEQQRSFLQSFINAVKFVGKNIDKVKISMIGAGAANVALAWLLISEGAKPGNIILVDSRTIGETWSTRRRRSGRYAK